MGTSPHNDGQWVQEFLWIGPDDPSRCAGEGTPEADPVDDDPYNLVDDCARVWGDFGLPADEGATTCPLNPRPRGTYQSTGGLLRFVDCIDNYRINDASVLLDDAQPVDETLGFQLGFGDAPKDRPDQSDSILNQENPYGQPSGEPTFSVWDCSSGGSSVSDPTGGSMRRVGVNDPTGLVPDEMADPRGGGQDPIVFKNEDGSLVAVNFTEDDGSLLRVHDARPPSLNPEGSPAGAVNDTLEGTPNVGFTSIQAPAIGLIFVNDDISVEGDDGDCDREEGIGENSDIYDLDEGDFEPSSPKRNDHDLFFNFRENAPRGLEDANHPLGESQPAAGGSGIGRDGALNSPLWAGAPGTTASRNGFVRIDDFNPRGAQYVTFYAYLDPDAISVNALSLANGGATSTYGSDHCIGTSPTTGAWSCDPAEWWVGPQDEDIKTVWQVKVGQPYQLRDIDCYDQTYAEGVPTTTALLTGTSCER